jgi:hypothetical protein
MATAIISGGRAFRTATLVFSIPPWSLCVGGTFAPNRCPDGNGHRFGRKSLQSATPVSSISPWSRLKPLLPIEIGLLRRCAPGVGLRRRKRHLPGRRRPTVGRRPSCRLKSAFQGAARRASAFADAKGTSRSAQAFTPIGNRPSKALRAGRRPSPTQKTPSRSAQADRWPKAPGGRIHSARRPTADRRPSRRLKSAFQGALAPGVGLRRRKERFSGRRRPTVGRRLSRRLEIGLLRHSRAGRWPSPTQKTPSRSA